MQKKDVVAKIAADTGITKKEATVAYNSFIEAVCEGLVGGDRVTLRNFGTFDTKWVEPRRMAYTFPTGEPMDVPGYYKVSFKASKVLKEKVKEK